MLLNSYNFQKCFVSVTSDDSRFKSYMTQLHTDYLMWKNNIAADNFTDLKQELNTCTNVGQYYRSDEAGFYQ